MMKSLRVVDVSDTRITSHGLENLLRVARHRGVALPGQLSMRRLLTNAQAPGVRAVVR